VGQAGIGLFFGLLALLGLIPLFLGIWLVAAGGAAIAVGVAVGSIAVVYWIILSVISAALSGIYNVALYRFAANGTVASGFSEDLVARRWVPKK
jgi:hypothetical protein